MEPVGEMECGSIGVMEGREVGQGGLTLRGVRIYAEKLRIFPRCFTKVRTDQGRNSAIVRIFTGGTLF